MSAQAFIEVVILTRRRACRHIFDTSKVPRLDAVRSGAGGLRIFAATTVSISAAAATGHPHAVTHISMRHIQLYQFDDASSRIDYLEGSLVAAQPGRIVDLNDVKSYYIGIEAARVVVPAATVTVALNRHIIPASGAGITDARVSLASDGLLIQGKIRKVGLPLSFSARALPEVTSQGDLRLRIVKMKAAHLFSKGFLDGIGLGASSLIKPKDPRILGVEGDALVIPISGMFPAPTLHGRLTAVRVTKEGIVATIGRSGAGKYYGAGRPYAAISGGAIRFAHIIMPDAKLKILPLRAEAEFRFSPVHYYTQMMAGYSRASSDYGLVGYFADFSTP